VEERYSSAHYLALDRGQWSTSCSSCFIPQENNSQYPGNKRVGGPWSWYGHFGEEIISSPYQELNPALPNP